MYEKLTKQKFQITINEVKILYHDKNWLSCKIVCTGFVMCLHNLRGATEYFFC